MGETIDQPSDSSKKRPFDSEASQENPEAPSKKVRLYSAQQFRKQLFSDQKLGALQEFLRLIKDPKSDHILSYLEEGGSPLEIVQAMENESIVPPMLVFEIVNRVLLQITVKYSHKYGKMAFDSCRQLITNHSSLITKMLGLSSSTKERLVVLKLLTSVATLSPTLAKDVLLHVNFNPTNLELMTKVADGPQAKNEVRDAFVHFLTAFLVDGHYASLSILLDKRGLMTSIISGLKFDQGDTVVLILTAMKNHILENPSVSKTMKMKTFSTPVVRDIVNLYNWKGPGGIPVKKSRTGAGVVEVDEVDKSKVNEAVHSFLLVLCTSHKHGVIFKDPTVGLGKKNQNSLMYTVLESLDRPWDHTYASDLVLKICKACPDLTKTMWSNLKNYLEPRHTDKWLSAVKFGEMLLDAVGDVDINLTEPNTNQVVQIIMVLAMPLPVIKTIVPGDKHLTYDHPVIRHRVISLLSKMAVSVLRYCQKYNTLDPLSNHVTRNFPSAESVLHDWQSLDADYLRTALDLLEIYKTIASQLLDIDTFDIRQFLSPRDPNLREVQLKAIGVFLDLDTGGLFGPKSDFFPLVLSFAFEAYYDLRDSRTLHGIFKKTGIFDGFEREIDLWIDGILNCKIYDQTVVDFIVDLITRTYNDLGDLNRRLFDLGAPEFGPMLLKLSDLEGAKSRPYVDFVVLNLCHLQADLSSFENLVGQVDCSPELLDYVRGWARGEAPILGKVKGRLVGPFREFVQGSHDLEDLDLYSNCRLHLLRAGLFNLTKSKDPKIAQLLEGYVNSLFAQEGDIEPYIRAILGHPSLKRLEVAKGDCCTAFVLGVVKTLRSLNRIQSDDLDDFTSDLVDSYLKVFKKPHKYPDLSGDLLEVFRLSYSQNVKLIEKFAANAHNCCQLFKIGATCVSQLTELARADSLGSLDKSIVGQLSDFLTILAKDQVANFHTFTSALLGYLETFPHTVSEIKVNIFDQLLNMTEFHKDNLALLQFLLARRPDFMGSVEDKVDDICSKKSLVLALLPIVVANDNHELMQQIFTKFEPSLLKALQKPQKAGLYFHNPSSYQSLGVLIDKFWDPGHKFGQGVLKFETCDIFHCHLLVKIFSIDTGDHANHVMTLVHLLITLLKHKTVDADKIRQVAEVVVTFFHKVTSDLSHLSSNDSVKVFAKLCLKYGFECPVLLKVLTRVMDFCICQDETESKLILDMLFSHSRFLDVVLGNFDPNSVEGESSKDCVLELWSGVITKWPQFMDKSQVTVILSAYRGTRRGTDRRILQMIKMYESRADQTRFFDFKPFLWGPAAASHYSVRSDLQKSLWRQPKMADVLDSLNQSTVQSTIQDPAADKSYDLDFFLPLFTHLLAPENAVQTYRFVKSGALALTVTGLRSVGESERQAACCVLSRFYFHLEAKHTGKDNLLWVRFVEAVCKGTAVLKDFRLNNFVGVYLGRSALILSQPTDVMYVPLSQYLTAKDSLDFTTIPELHTFLHSPDVNSKEHKMFILELLRDGLKTHDDFSLFLRSMAFKLVVMLLNSTICDFDMTLAILDILKLCCNLGLRIMCDSLGFLAEIHSFALGVTNGHVMLKVLEILLCVLKGQPTRHACFTVYNLLSLIVRNGDAFERCVKSHGRNLELFHELLVNIVGHFSDLISMDDLRVIVENSGAGGHFYDFLAVATEEDLSASWLRAESYNLRLLCWRKLRSI